MIEAIMVMLMTLRRTTQQVCYACKLSSGYIAVAIQRWVDVTGCEPVLIENMTIENMTIENMMIENG